MRRTLSSPATREARASAARGCGRRACPCPALGGSIAAAAPSPLLPRFGRWPFAWRDRRSLDGQHGLDRRTRAFERGRQARDLGGDVVDALAQQRILDALGTPRWSRRRASWSPISRCSLTRSSIAAASCASSWPDLGAELVASRIAAAAGVLELARRSSFELGAPLELAAQPVDLGYRARPGGGPDRRAAPRAPARGGSSLGLGRLHDELPFELAVAAAETAELAALVVQLLG